jgi:exonuclease SbcC
VRPHSLTISGFLAYGGEVTINFDDLSSSGLFLVYGDTGAGKTTIFDAISYALFNKVPGQRAKTSSASENYRSHHANSKTDTYVILDASVGQRRLRIHRSPKYIRPKRVGEGTTEEKAKVTVEEWNGSDWDALVTSVSGADHEINNWIQLSAEQFFKLVLLPQGEFAEFLKDSGKDRDKILRKLFDVDAYVGIERWFSDEEDRRVKKRYSAESNVEVAKAKVGAFLGKETSEIKSTEWLDDQISAIDKILPNLNEELSSKNLAFEKALEAETIAKTKFQTYRKYQDAKTDLDTKQAAWEEFRANNLALIPSSVTEAKYLSALGKIERDLENKISDASKVNSLIEDWAIEQKTYLGKTELILSEGQKISDNTTFVASNQKILKELGDKQSKVDELFRGSEEAKNKVEPLESLLSNFENLVNQREEISVLAEKIVTTQHEVSELSLSEDEKKTLEERIERLLPGIETLTGRITTLERDLDVILKIESAQKSLGPLQQNLKVSEKEELTAEESLKMARDHFVESQAGELAKLLAEGVQCPVCGSSEHPKKAAISQESNRDVLDQAEKSFRAASRKRELAAESLQKPLADIAAFKATLSDPTFVEKAKLDSLLIEQRNALVSSKTELENARKSKITIEANEARANFLTLAITNDSARHGELVIGCGKLEKHIKKDSDKLIGINQELSVELISQKLREVQSSMVTLTTQHKEAAAAKVDYEKLKGDLNAKLTEIAVSQAKIDAAKASSEESLTRILGLEKQLKIERGEEPVAVEITSIQNELVRIKELVEEGGAINTSVSNAKAIVKNFNLADFKESVDVTHAEEIRIAAELERQEAIAALGTAEKLKSDINANRNELLNSFNTLYETSTALEELQKISRHVGGQGPKKTPLVQYYLSAMLKQVLHEANGVLQEITDNRYALYNDNEAGGRGQVFLTIAVTDSWTGESRPSYTLSGGETFVCSLALALGLANAVKQGAGLDSLFIDEGFGTLDQTYLESVMQSLDRLRSTGKLIGLISHVSELKQRIPTRIHVIKGRQGSTVEIDLEDE